MHIEKYRRQWSFFKLNEYHERDISSLQSKITLLPTQSKERKMHSSFNRLLTLFNMSHYSKQPELIMKFDFVIVQLLSEMPGKVGVKIKAGRNLPIMDRTNETTDAYVEIKLGTVTQKTDVCRKSLNPQWNTDW